MERARMPKATWIQWRKIPEEKGREEGEKSEESE